MQNYCPGKWYLHFSWNTPTFLKFYHSAFPTTLVHYFAPSSRTLLKLEQSLSLSSVFEVEPLLSAIANIYAYADVKVFISLPEEDSLVYLHFYYEGKYIVDMRKLFPISITRLHRFWVMVRGLVEFWGFPTQREKSSHPQGSWNLEWTAWVACVTETLTALNVVFKWALELPVH